MVPLHIHGRNDSDALFITLQVNGEAAVCTLITRQTSLVTNAKSLGSMSKKDFVLAKGDTGLTQHENGNP